MIQKKYLLSLLVLNCISSATFAGEFTLITQLGLAANHFGNTYLQATPIEIDNLKVTQTNVSPEMGVGVGYVPGFWMGGHYPNFEVLNRFKISLNYRISNPNTVGSVYQFQDPTMNNYYFNLKTIREQLVVNLQLNLIEYLNYSVYVMSGAGFSWSKVKYCDTARNFSQGGNLTLRNTDSSGPVYELGLGLSHTANERVELFLEYRFSFLPMLYPANRGYLNGADVHLIKSASFFTRAQSINFGVNWKL